MLSWPQKTQKIGALHAVRSKAYRPPGRWPQAAPFSIFAGSRAQPCSLAGRPPRGNLRRQAIPFTVALWLCRPSPGVHLPLPAPPTPAGPLCSPPPLPALQRTVLWLWNHTCLQVTPDLIGEEAPAWLVPRQDVPSPLCGHL